MSCLAGQGQVHLIIANDQEGYHKTDHHRTAHSVQEEAGLPAYFWTLNNLISTIAQFQCEPVLTNSGEV